MVSRLHSRLARLEASQGGGDGCPMPRVIFLIGGGQPFPSAFSVPDANGGRAVVKQKRGEVEADFRQRVADVATEAGAGKPVIVAGVR